MEKTLKLAFFLSLTALLSSGCTTTKPMTDTFCQNAYDIGLDKGTERLSDLNAKKVQAMDEYGMLHCGW